MTPPPFQGGQGRGARDVVAGGRFFLVWALVLGGWCCWALAQWWRATR